MYQCKNVFIAFIFLFSAIATAQQDFIIDSNYLLFEDAKTKEPVLLYNDSTLVRGHDFKTHQAIDFPKGLIPSDFNHYSFQLQQRNYMVDNGCGVVIAYSNNQFTRIDNSFQHKNQYGAVPFQYKNDIYLWGGYGMFTFKNILTQYSFDTHEWNVIEIKNRNLIEERARAISVLKDATLYVFSGDTFVGSDLTKSGKIKDNTVYALDLQKMVWSKKGRYTPLIDFTPSAPQNTFQKDSRSYIVKTDILEIDPFNNTVNRYKLADFKNIKSILYHKKTKKVSYVYLVSSGELRVFSESFESFKGELISSKQFYQPVINTSWLMYGGGGVLLLLFIAIVYVMLKGYHKKRNALSYNSQKQAFYYQTNTVTCFSDLQKEVLVYLTKNQGQYVLLTSINDIVLKGHENENHTTTIKRRETLLKELATELGALLTIDKNNVMSTQKSANDRRVKEIKLNIAIRVV